MLRKLSVVVSMLLLLAVSAAAQDANTIIGNASKAMGADGLNSIVISGSAMNGNFGQSNNISGPLQMTTINNFRRAIDFTQPALRSTGATIPPIIPGAAAQPGNFNQNITAANKDWGQQLEIYVTPWGFLKGAAANNAMARTAEMNGKNYSVVTWMTPQKAPSGLAYKVVGYINDQNIVDRVETWIEHPILGDLHVDSLYSDYKDFDGLKVPTKIVQKRFEIESFTASITDAKANPSDIAQLLQPPAGGRGGGGAGGPGGAPAAPTVEAQKLADGVYRITGPYVSMAVEFKDYVVVLEGAQPESRGDQVIGETKKLFPNKPIRYVVNTHSHFDHAGGLAPFVAEGITIITQENNRQFLQTGLSAPRTLVGDALSKAPKKAKVEGVGEKRVIKDATRSIEIYHIRPYSHTNGMLIVLFPKEKILYSADYNVPAPGGPVSAFNAILLENVDRLHLDFDRHVIVHMPNPDRPLTKADLVALVKEIKQ